MCHQATKQNAFSCKVQHSPHPALLPPPFCAAPHPKHAKESACGCAGLFSAPVALPLYAHAFEQAGALQHLEAFASFNGPDFYGLPRNTGEGLGES